MFPIESIVEDAALEWFLQRQRQGYGGQVGHLGYAVGYVPKMAQGAAVKKKEVEI